MRYILNVVYLFALLLFSPWLIYKALTTGKYRRGVWRKLTGSAFLRTGNQPSAWFHGVSVGEIHLLRQVVACFRQRHPDWQVVISTTTDTGFDEATKRFPDLTVFYWPFDFSWAVRRALRRVRPNLLILAEGEMWPNMLLAAKDFDIPVAVINARMSPRSFSRYRKLRWLVGSLFERVDLFAVQTEEYAENLRQLGAKPERVHVTGSVKYDGVETDHYNPRTNELRRLFSVQADDLIWVAGSTQAPEEEIVLGIYLRAKVQHPNLRLFIVPRQKDRFEEVAGLLRRSGQPFVRRSTLSAPLGERDANVLVDTIGELSAIWGLADVAFVGGSLDGKRGGQNMIEPAAYGAAVVFGPHVWNFKETAARLVARGGALQVSDSGELEKTTVGLLQDAPARRRLGDAARRFVQQQQGATEKTIELLGSLMPSVRAIQEAA